MKAYELYDAVYDSARQEWVPESPEEQVKDVVEYADNCFNVTISKELAQKIVECRQRYTKACNGKLDGFDAGEWTHNFYVLVKSELEDIEI